MEILKKTPYFLLVKLDNTLSGFTAPTTFDVTLPTRLPPKLNPEDSINFVNQAVAEICQKYILIENTKTSLIWVYTTVIH